MKHEDQKVLCMKYDQKNMDDVSLHLYDPMNIKILTDLNALYQDKYSK